MIKKYRFDLLLAGGVLLLAGLLSLLLRSGEAGAWAVVAVDGVETARYPLSQDLTVTIGTDRYNVLTISRGAAAVTEANCGDRTCVGTGAVSRAGESILCLPHRLSVRIEGPVCGAGHRVLVPGGHGRQPQGLRGFFEYTGESDQHGAAGKGQ